MRPLKAVAALLRPSVMLIAAAVPLAVALSVAVPPAVGRPSCALAAGAPHVAVVVEHASGRVLTSCVSLDSTQRTGDWVMQMSGIPYAAVAFGGFGKAVCQIDQEPPSYPPSCWTSSSFYWGMFVSHAGGPWAVARNGISSQQLSDGDALGWHYLPANGAGGPPPSPAGVCVPAAPLPVPSPTISTSTPIGPTATPSLPAGPTSAPTEITSATPSDALPTQAPAGTSPAPGPPAFLGHRDPGHAPGPAGPDLGWLAATAGAGALIGLLAVRLLARRIGR